MIKLEGGSDEDIKALDFPPKQIDTEKKGKTCFVLFFTIYQMNSFVRISDSVTFL